MRLSGTLLAILIAAMVGCVGELEMPDRAEPAMTPSPDPAPNPGSIPAPTSARTLFDTSVAPVLAAKCDGCHGGAAPVVGNLAFLGVDTAQPDLVYGALEGMLSIHNQFSPGSLLVDNEGHAPAYDYTDQEMASIVEWMDAERFERGLLEAQGDKLAEFAGCMELGAWNSTEVYRLADEQVNNNNNNRCYNCHNDAQWGVGLSSDDTNMFKQNRTKTNIKVLFMVDNELGIVVPNHEKLMLYAMGGPVGYNHPRFDYDEDSGDYRRLEEFYQRTMERMTTTDCEAIGYPAP